MPASVSIKKLKPKNGLEELYRVSCSVPEMRYGAISSAGEMFSAMADHKPSLRMLTGRECAQFCMCELVLHSEESYPPRRSELYDIHFWTNVCSLNPNGLTDGSAVLVKDFFHKGLLIQNPFGGYSLDWKLAKDLYEEARTNSHSEDLMFIDEERSLGQVPSSDLASLPLAAWLFGEDIARFYGSLLHVHGEHTFTYLLAPAIRLEGPWIENLSHNPQDVFHSGFEVLGPFKTEFYAVPRLSKKEREAMRGGVYLAEGPEGDLSLADDENGRVSLSEGEGD